ncbi:hypothetical protein HA402_003436 [Bradysia odoriphaga]|nr:hypothetical protein HA402_003436 [Bradysia odoriphaga]
MMCWQSEDAHLLKLDPFPFGRGVSFKQEHLKSSVPIPIVIPYPHPWPTHNPLPEQCVTNELLDPGLASNNLSHQPIIFPNLVNGFERNPTAAARSYHSENTNSSAARAALYTRYTPSEWFNSNMATFTESDINRNQSERLRNDAVRLMRQTDEKTTQSQRDAGRRLGERLTDLTFWRNELNTELEKLLSEYALLSDTRRKTNKALQDLDPPLHIAQECLYHRESRQGINKVHDNVEKSLLTEVDNLRNSQEKLKMCLDMIDKQLSDLRACQHALQEDIIYKESTLEIDTVCHKLSNFSRAINYFDGIEKYDPTISSIETWSRATSLRINKSQEERGKSAQLRSNTDTLINSVASLTWNSWSGTNNALNKRSSEMCEAKNNMQLHLHKTQQEIFDIERNIDLLRKAIQDKANPLKVAQTRLEARGHRAGLEQCKDFAHVRLVQEVHEIQESINVLHRKLKDAEGQHQHLLQTKANLESNLKKKVNALFIDREKCMGIRRSFPVDSLIKY